MDNKGTKADKNKRPIYKKWWFWVIIVVVLIGIGGSSMKSDEPTKVGSGSTSVSEEEQEERTEFAVGDVISFDEKEITVVSVERSFNSGNEFYQPDTGKEFIKVNVKIENKSSEKISYNSYDWEIQDSDGDIQNVDAGLQFTVEGALGSGDLASGGKKSADLYFQVPKDDAGLVLHYKASFWSNKTINIKL